MIEVYPMNSLKMPLRSLGGGLLLLLLAACASSPRSTVSVIGPAVGPAPFEGRQATDYFASRNGPAQLERCLLDRVPSGHVVRGIVTTVYIGPDSADQDWVITLGDNGNGSNVSVYRPLSGDGNPEEPELRYDLARCTTA
jgi:hypothetical protein